MNVGIDATLLISKDKITGVERYIINLIKHISAQHTNYNLYVIFRNAIYKDLDLYTDKFVPIIIKSDNRILIDQFLIPFYALKYKIELMHFPVFGAPVLYRRKSVLTIHDAAFWLYPKTISKGGKFYYKPLFKQSIKRAQKIITVSENSKNDLIKIFNLDPKKIITIYEAVDDNFLFQNNDEKFLLSEYYQYKNQYILSVGTIEPRKNLVTLLDAFKIIKLQYKYNVKLLLIGRQGWINELQISDEVKDDIIFTGFIDEEILPALYRNALVYAFPSLYEGFGFPLLEAFASGTPVIASNNSSLPEIGRDACIYVNSHSALGFAQAIKQIITDEVKRNELIQNGYNRLKDFDWNKCAKATLEVYALAIENDA